MEKYRPHPEQQHHSPEGGRSSHGFQNRQPEQTQPQQGRAEGRESLQGPTIVDRSDPADGDHRNPIVQPPVFGNCIIRGLMPSPEQVERRLAQGFVTEEEAVEEKKEAMIRQQMYEVSESLQEVQGMLRACKDRLSTEEKRHLSKEERRLKKEWDRLWNAGSAGLENDVPNTQ